jgi:hypothetical protein
MVVLAIIVLVGLFLSIRVGEALAKAGFGFLTTQAWEPDSNNFGIAGILTGTVFLAALVVAMKVTPIASSMMREAFSQAWWVNGRAPTRSADPLGDDLRGRPARRPRRHHRRHDARPRHGRSARRSPSR